MNRSTDDEVGFTCKCRKRSGAIRDGEYSEPCPDCGRRYKGVYSKSKKRIEVKELKKSNFLGRKEEDFRR